MDWKHTQLDDKQTLRKKIPIKLNYNDSEGRGFERSNTTVERPRNFDGL